MDTLGSTSPAEILRGATLRIAASAAVLCVSKTQNQKIRRSLIQPARTPKSSLLNEWTRGELNPSGRWVENRVPDRCAPLVERKPATVDCNRLSVFAV